MIKKRTTILSVSIGGAWVGVSQYICKDGLRASYHEIHVGHILFNRMANRSVDVVLPDILEEDVRVDAAIFWAIYRT